MQKIVGLRRSGDKNIYYFLQDEDYVVGDKVVATFEEFQTVGTVVKTGVNVDESKASELAKITRRATASDLKKYDELAVKAKGFLPIIKKKSLELGLMMKFVSADYNLDGSKIMIVFSSEERVDFRQFLKDLAGMLKTRIELKQIGQRDEIKILGGVGPCGEPCCCARFLEDFEHVTVKMAKVQGLSLSPTKINGICGRLMCCLGYESDMYDELLANMPKVGSEVMSPNGKGIVVYNDLLRERVSVKRQAEGDTFVVEDFDLEEISAGDKKFKRIIEKTEKKAEPKPEKELFLNDIKTSEKPEKKAEKPAKEQKQKEQKPTNKKEEVSQKPETEKPVEKKFNKHHGKRHHFKPKPKGNVQK